MIDGLKPYPNMRDSEVPWLGEVPEHWNVIRLRDSIEDCINGIWGDEPNGRDDLPCVRVADFDRHRLRVRLATPTMRAIAPNERRRRMLKSGDLLLEKSGGGEQQLVGVVVLYDYDVPAVCSNFVARLPVSAGFDPCYLTYLHSYLYAIHLNIRSIKQTTGIQNLDSAAYLSEPVAFPPLPEQDSITRFLDHADGRIRRYIRAKQKLIKLLEEQKQAVIHRAVTRGLDPKVRLKSSGVELVGDVPERWEIRRGKYYFREIDDRSASGAEELMSVSHKTGVTPRSEKNITMFKAESYVGHKLCRPGDIVVNTMWAWMAAVGVSRKIGIVSPSYGVYRPRTEDVFRSAYLDLLLRTEAYRHEYVRGSRGITTSRLRLYPDDFLRILFICPSLHEQDDILLWIQSETAESQRAIDIAAREIALLREFRCRLIADVVTGKLDVREAATRLPEKATEAEPLDEIDDLPQDESAADDAELEAAE